MKHFSMPADFKKETIDKYVELNQSYNDSKVVDTYGNVTLGSVVGSGRPIGLLPRINFNKLKEYVKYSKDRDIEFSYTMNASHMQNIEFSRRGIIEITSLLGKLYDIGIRSLIISLPSLMEIVKSSKYDFKVKASVICQITNVEKALFYKELGTDKIVIDESVNRDFYTLKKIRDVFGEKVEVIANSICHKNCTYRMFHYNQISADSIEVSSEVSTNYYNHRCLFRRFVNRGNLLKLTWIRPEDIKYYTKIGIKHFKIQGRHSVMEGDPAKAVEYYFKESFDGDLLELLDLFNPTSNFKVSLDNKKLDGFIKPFVQKRDHCQNNCPDCKYCENFAKKCINHEELESIYKEVVRFVSQYDKFTMLLREINSRGKKNERQMNAGFDLD